VKQRGGFWHALPRDAAAWWRQRAEKANYWRAAIDEQAEFGLKIEVVKEEAVVES
jgi:hypothetical protein